MFIIFLSFLLSASPVTLLSALVARELVPEPAGFHLEARALWQQWGCSGARRAKRVIRKFHGFTLPLRKRRNGEGLPFCLYPDEV